MLGQFDVILKTAFDFDYWLRAFKHFPQRIAFIQEVQAKSRLHDACITRRNRRAVILEGMELLNKYFGYAPKEWLLTYLIECLPQATDQHLVHQLKHDVDSMLSKVSPWLRPHDLQQLRVMLAKPQTWQIAI